MKRKKTEVYSPDGLFDYQLQRLARCGFAAVEFEKLRGLVPDAPYRDRDCLIPFIIVPKWNVPLSNRVSCLGEKTTGHVLTDVGITSFDDESKLVNLATVPEEHYLALNFDIGIARDMVLGLPHNPKFANHRYVTQFEGEPKARLDATVDEGVAAWLYFCGIGDTYTMLKGSSYAGRNPCLVISPYKTDTSLSDPDSFRPFLTSHPRGLSGGNFGYATCAKRMA
jgi:hypothetical protein